MFNQPLDKEHRLYKEIKDSYKTLNMLELRFKIGEYKVTDEIAQEFQKMILNKYKMSMNGGDPSEYSQIQSFNARFD